MKNKETQSGQEAIAIVTRKSRDIKSEKIKSVADTMLAEISHGKEWQSKDLADLLQMQPNNMQFGLAMSEVNLALEKQGYHLSTRGTQGKKYFVEPIDRTCAIGASMQRDAMNTLKRAVIFLNGVAINHAEKISEGEKRRIEKQAEQAALRYVLCKRMR